MTNKKKRQMRACDNCRHFISYLNGADEKNDDIRDIDCYKSDALIYLESIKDPEYLKLKDIFSRVSAFCPNYKRKITERKKMAGRMLNLRTQNKKYKHMIEYDKKTMEKFKDLIEWKQELVVLIVTGKMVEQNGEETIYPTLSKAEAYRKIAEKFNLGEHNYKSDSDYASRLLQTQSMKLAQQEIKELSKSQIENNALKVQSYAVEQSGKVLTSINTDRDIGKMDKLKANIDVVKATREITKEEDSNSGNVINVAFGNGYGLEDFARESDKLNKPIDVEFEEKK